MTKLLIFFLIITLLFADGFRSFPSITSSSSMKKKLRHPETSLVRLHLFDRITRVITSNVNNFIKGLEDPEKIIEQAVLDMQNDLIKIRQSYAEVSATQKRMERQLEQAQGAAAEWYRRAQLALQKGDEELAKEALSRRQVQLDIVENLTKQIKIQADGIEKLYSSMQALETKISDAKRQKEALIARARTAKTSVQVNDMLSTLKTSSSMEAFERMKDKVETLETQAEVAGELASSSSFGPSTPGSLEDRFRALEGSTVIDDELEKLKRQLPGGQKQIAQLPAASSLDLDAEYEQLKREMRRK
eukprot:gene7590-8390_t